MHVKNLRPRLDLAELDVLDALVIRWIPAVARAGALTSETDDCECQHGAVAVKSPG